MSEGSFWRSLSPWLYGGSSLVSVACEVAVLVTILTIVRRHRPDAYRGLQAWAIGSLVTLVVLTVAHTVVPLLGTMTNSFEAYFRTNALLVMLGTVVHIVLVVLLIRGLTALAQPPKPIVVEGAPPYR